MPCMCITTPIAYSVRPRRLSPLSLNFFISAFHGSHTVPYFLRSRVSSSRCSFYKHMGKCQDFCLWQDARSRGRGRTRNTHKVQGLLAAVHIRKYLFQLMTFQALGMLESPHDILLERLLQLVFFRIRPPPAVLEEEPVTSNGVIDALTIFDLLPSAVGK